VLSKFRKDGSEVKTHHCPGKRTVREDWRFKNNVSLNNRGCEGLDALNMAKITLANTSRKSSKKNSS
jgi:hypothetical protein